MTDHLAIAEICLLSLADQPTVSEQAAVTAYGAISLPGGSASISPRAAPMSTP